MNYYYDIQKIQGEKVFPDKDRHILTHGITGLIINLGVKI